MLVAIFGNMSLFVCKSHHMGLHFVNTSAQARQAGSHTAQQRHFVCYGYIARPNERLDKVMIALCLSEGRRLMSRHAIDQRLSLPASASHVGLEACPACLCTRQLPKA